MYQNMNGFMAMMIGIGNQAVSRLYNTWEKLPAKYRKLVQEYESILVSIWYFFSLFAYVHAQMHLYCTNSWNCKKGYSLYYRFVWYG